MPEQEDRIGAPILAIRQGACVYLLQLPCRSILSFVVLSPRFSVGIFMAAFSHLSAFFFGCFDCR